MSNVLGDFQNLSILQKKQEHFTGSDRVSLVPAPGHPHDDWGWPFNTEGGMRV